VGKGLREFKQSLSEADPRHAEEDDYEEPAPKRAPAKPPATD
jgi:hypothetical protein